MLLLDNRIGENNEMDSNADRAVVLAVLTVLCLHVRQGIYEQMNVLGYLICVLKTTYYVSMNCVHDLPVLYV